MIVEQVSEDRLARTMWEFRHSGDLLVLTRFANEERKTTRHKWTGKFWSSNDERPPWNLPRPTEIPQWVQQAALEGIVFRVAIGWANEKYVVGNVRTTASKNKVK